MTTTLNAEKNQPYMLAFFFAPDLNLEVTAEVQKVEDGNKTVLTLPCRNELCTPETWVYSAYHTFTSTGWYIVHYRANYSPGGEFASSDIRRIMVEDSVASNTPTELTREVQEDMKVTTFNSVVLNNRGTLSFKTRTR